MQITKDLIKKLKEVKAEKSLSLSKIVDMIEQNGEYVSKTSLSRVFADDSETEMFKPDTLLPIARALLDVETLEESDTLDEQAMKTLLQYKSKRISDLEQQLEQLKASLDHEKVKSHEKLDAERASHQRSIEFLKSQIELKDRRYDTLLETVNAKDAKFDELLSLILSCPCRKAAEPKE